MKNITLEFDPGFTQTLDLMFDPEINFDINREIWP